MVKNTTIGVRVDEKLKEEAQAVFEKLGLPLSLGVELFLRQVVAQGKLPFALGSEENNKKDEEEYKAYWKAFILWYFRCWPIFYSSKDAEIAREEYGFTDEGSYATAMDFLDKVKGHFDVVDESEYFKAVHAVSVLESLLSEAKELIYWALGLDKVFVPELSARYSNESEEWKLEYLKELNEPRCSWDDDEDEDDIIADGVIGARYFGTGSYS